MQKKIALILVLLLLNSCAHQERSITRSASYSKAETELGEAIHREILQTMPIYLGAELNEYVRSIGEKLMQAAERRDLAYRFVILDDDRIYATNAPGGYVYITTGFFKFLQSEIEVAGILAEEIGLLQYKDPRLSKVQKTLELLLHTGSYVAPAFGAIGSLSLLGLVLIVSARGNRKALAKRLDDADRRALRYLVECDYDPQGLIDPLRRMMEPESSYRAYLYDYLQSHPISPERLKKLEHGFNELPLANRQFEAGRDTFLMMTEGVRKGQARK